MFHFEEISAMALERGAARHVPDSAALADAVALYFAQPELRRVAGEAAHTLLTDNHGALARTLDHMEGALRARGLGSDRARTATAATVPERAG
jgi:3-deoxy-D-manno-octulosonic-acid transferase